MSPGSKRRSGCTGTTESLRSPGLLRQIQRFPACLANILLQYLFLIFKISGGIPGDDDKKPGPCTSFSASKTSSSSSLQVVIFAATMDTLKPISSKADFVFSDLDLGLPHFFHRREAVIPRHEVGRYFAQGVIGRCPPNREFRGPRPVIDLHGRLGKHTGRTPGGTALVRMLLRTARPVAAEPLVRRPQRT